MSQLTDARILNESIVDVADQHTILDHIGKKVAIRGKKTRSNSRPAQRKSPVAPLPFETQKSYCNLLARMDGKAIAYSDVHGSDGTLHRCGDHSREGVSFDAPGDSLRGGGDDR